ncbi:MAG: hypothetical protein ACI4U3_00315, partial [Traorella sp.]
LLLTGCINSNLKNNQESKEKYENYVGLIIDNSKQVSTNIPFDWHFTMYQENQKYAYEVKIDNPQVAMTKIQMLVVDIENIKENETEPCTGIFESNTYNMIPNQFNPEKRYYENISVNGITEKSKFVLNCLVVYTDKNQNVNYVYFIINADYKDYTKEVDTNE